MLFGLDSDLPCKIFVIFPALLAMNFLNGIVFLFGWHIDPIWNPADTPYTTCFFYMGVSSINLGLQNPVVRITRMHLSAMTQKNRLMNTILRCKSCTPKIDSSVTWSLSWYKTIQNNTRSIEHSYVAKNYATLIYFHLCSPRLIFCHLPTTFPLWLPLDGVNMRRSRASETLMNFSILFILYLRALNFFTAMALSTVCDFHQESLFSD
ncbi:hypothetical protein K439DRAFT_270019 [Ramaria rubella]|nr:hypothetical protein K439DRAFT_270019 [Ramaria rubella]